MTERKYASFPLRLLAYLIDNSILLFFNAFAWLLISSSSNISQLVLGLLTYLAVLVFPEIILIGILYMPLMTVRFGGTLGKLLTGLKVTDEAGNLLTIKRSVFRHTIGYAFSYTFFGLGYLAVIKDKAKQAWHDKATGSVVVVRKNIWPAGLLTLIILLIANIFMVISAINRFSKGPVKDQISELITAYQTEKRLKEASPSSALNFKSPPAKENASQSAKEKEDIAAWSREIEFIEEDLANLQSFKGNLAYDQQKLLRANEILIEQKPIASNLYNKMVKGLPLTPSDDNSLSRYNLLSIEYQQLTKDLFGNIQTQ